MKRFSFYVVYKGRQTGIFRDWHTEVEPAVKGFPDARYYGFNDLEEAEKAFDMGLEQYEAVRFKDTCEDDKEFQLEW